MSNERRQHKRIAAELAASIVDGDDEPTKGTIANLSERGSFIRGDVGPELHRPVHLQFILKPEHTVCTASGKVAWLGPLGFGVFFDDANDALREFIQELAKAAESINPAPKKDVLSRVLGDVDVAIE